MSAPAPSLRVQVKELLGQARLIYWDDPEASADLHELQCRLDQPLVLGVAGSSENADALVAHVTAVAGGSVQFGENPAAVVLLLPRADEPDETDVPPTMPEATLGVVRAGEPWPPPAELARFRRVVAFDPASAQREPDADDALLGAVAELARDAEPLRLLHAIECVRRLTGTRPRRGAEELAAHVARLLEFAPERRELSAAISLRRSADAFAPAEAVQALEILDAALALAGPRLSDELVSTGLLRWRGRAQDPTLSRAGRAVALTVARTCERLSAAPESH